MKISKELRVGVLAIVSITILYFGFNFLKGIDFLSPNNTYYAIYENVDGLNVSNPVMINGFAVGRVSDIEILQTQGNQLLVSLDISNSQVLGARTQAIIRSDLLGTKAVHLDSIQSGPPLKAGDTLQASLDKGFTEVLSNSAIPLVDRLEVTLLNLNTILANLANNEDSINDIIGNFKATSGNLAKGTAQLDDLGKQLDNLLTQLNDPQKGLGALMTSMNQVVDSVNQLQLEAMLTTTKNTVEELGKTLELINEGQGSMGMLLKDDALYSKMNQAVEDLDKLFLDMKENPGRYVHFSVFGRKDKGPKRTGQEAQE